MAVPKKDRHAEKRAKAPKRHKHCGPHCNHSDLDNTLLMTHTPLLYVKRVDPERAKIHEKEERLLKRRKLMRSKRAKV